MLCNCVQEIFIRYSIFKWKLSYIISNYAFIFNVDEKTPSAKTITLRGSTTNSQEKRDKKGEEEEEEAAKKIQAAFRGHKTRKSMKQPEKSAAAGEQEASKEQLEAEFRPDDQGTF